MGKRRDHGDDGDQSLSRKMKRALVRAKPKTVEANLGKRSRVVRNSSVRMSMVAMYTKVPAEMPVMIAVKATE